MRKMRLFHYGNAKGENFGDDLNYSIAKMFGLDIVWANPRTCEAVFVGSLLDNFLYPYDTYMKLSAVKLLLNPINVWGTGFISDINSKIVRPNGLLETNNRRLNIFAVRGNFTKQRLEKMLNKKLNNITIADPGILVSELTNISHIEKRFSLGIIPHYSEKNIEIPSKLLYRNTTIIDVTEEPEKVIRNIAQCRVILSSSLHGLIAADSIGIPNARIILSDKLLGGNYKFEDYYSSYSIRSRLSFDLCKNEINFNDIASIVDKYEINKNEIDKKKEALLNSFPYK